MKRTHKESEYEDYYENELRNYHIPKRNLDELDTKNGNDLTIHNMQTPLINSYYNGYNYNLNSYCGGYSQPHYYNEIGEDNAIKPTLVLPLPPPPPPPPLPPSSEQLEESIFNSLKDFREKPKTYKAGIYQATVPDIMDESLPSELKLLFQPLYCKLCSAQLSSNQVAKIHYKSKNHEKKIKKWLQEYSARTGEPLHKRAKLSNEKQLMEAIKNPNWFYCDVCDLQLTGRLHAESHYMGRNHRKALMGFRSPAGSGYYDANGKWVRTKQNKTTNNTADDDNFGLAFRSTQISDTLKKKKETQQQQETAAIFHCDICSINTTCQEQLENHFKGQKHFKKLKQLGLNRIQPSVASNLYQTIYTNVPLQPMVNIVNSGFITDENDLNLSVYRTPSGDYYCPICNMTTNSEDKFVQHLKSRGHIKKAALKRGSDTEQQHI